MIRFGMCIEYLQGHNHQALNFQYSSFLVEVILIFIHFNFQAAGWSEEKDFVIYGIFVIFKGLKEEVKVASVIEYFKKIDQWTGLMRTLKNENIKFQVLNSPF
ncbi:unnamed protein product [Paramecium pentaurelia]|uniref:Uncharacterized protein n=1 Tax=Paramecium pentaurelia TaxID=43138 RepID=A0A8S1T917_9CILI|nr:unnamed protein product [Paramecium pentaurelia]